jgi:dihydrofolate synthase / folylpolyglutamate synthase
MSFSNLSDWLAWQETLHPRPVDLGLGRIERVLGRLDWQRPRCPVITVAGTNGKGSCVALLAGILGAAGYRTGTFTSPHLHRYNGRIQVAGLEASDASLIAAFERIEAARRGETLTFFEFNALAALLIFATAGLDCITLEVGMGGRLDAVNVVDADVALVTSIGLDHCEWLGATVEAIGAEKAGIFRPGRPAILGSRDMPASVRAAAEGIGAPLQQLGRDFDFALQERGWSWRGGAVQIEGLPSPRLPGLVQYANAAAVIAVLQAIGGQLPVHKQALVEGLRSTSLAGRFEVRPGPIAWIFDVAHNPAAARVLAENLANSPGSGRTLAVCGILGEKDVASIAVELRGLIDAWILAGLAGPRAVSGDALKERFERAQVAVTSVAADVGAACEAARGMAQPGDRVVVFGSFLVVGPAREWHSSGHATD